MGLGKTVQAIAACELLARLRGVGGCWWSRPASLKAEWEEQIARFTERDGRFVAGRVPSACAYREPTVLHARQLRAGGADADEINACWQAGRRHPRRGPADQELADQDRAQGQARSARPTPSC
jgi:hypothetical protein